MLSSKYTHDNIERHRFSRGFFLMYPLIFSCIFFQFFLLIPPKCDTCDSKKTTLRLECAHLCAPMRAREKRSPKKFSPRFSSFSFLPPSSLPLSSFSLTSPFFSSGASNTCKFLFCYMHITGLKVSQEKNAFFPDFFTLWGNTDPYTNRASVVNHNLFIN